MDLSCQETARLFHRRTANIYQHHRKRARADRQELDYTLEQFRSLVRSWDRCAYCGTCLTPSSFSVDHCTATSRHADYRLINLALCCELCNQHKGALSAGEFLSLLRYLDTLGPWARTDVLRRLRAGGRIHARR